MNKFWRQESVTPRQRSLSASFRLALKVLDPRYSCLKLERLGINRPVRYRTPITLLGSQQSCYNQEGRRARAQKTSKSQRRRSNSLSMKIKRRSWSFTFRGRRSRIATKKLNQPSTLSWYQKSIASCQRSSFQQSRGNRNECLLWTLNRQAPKQLRITHCAIWKWERWRDLRWSLTTQAKLFIRIHSLKATWNWRWRNLTNWWLKLWKTASSASKILANARFRQPTVYSYAKCYTPASIVNWISKALLGVQRCKTALTKSVRCTKDSVTVMPRRYLKT